MGKLTIQEITAILVEKNGFEKREANSFASAMFAIIQERLETDQIVKVKGLGTFKIVDVEARESVSVRTGERVTISGHAKVTFTPDATMKELVNKPFSQFETVVLNDGVEFDDIKDDSEAEEFAVPVVEEEPALIVEEPAPVVEEEIPAPVVEEETSAPLAQSLVEVVEEQPSVEEEQPSVEEAQPSVEVEETLEEEEERKTPWLWWALGTLMLMALSAWGGYYYGSQQQSSAVLPDTVLVHDTVMVAPVDTVPVAETPAPEQVVETLAPQPVVEAPAPAKPAKTEPVKAEPKKEPAQESIDKYAAKDARVRLGAYRIVGLEREVTVQLGQTFYSICKGNLGPDMECYVEVYNDLPRNPKIKVGQVIKIPKLQVKKRKK